MPTHDPEQPLDRNVSQWLGFRDSHVVVARLADGSGARSINIELEVMHLETATEWTQSIALTEAQLRQHVLLLEAVLADIDKE